MSPGSVVKVTNRYIRRVMRLDEAHDVWPDAQRRKELSDYAWSTFGLRGCIVSVDGTTIPLAYARSYQPWTFWDPQDEYSMHLLVATDHQRNIISATLGFSGAAGDALAQRHAEWEGQPRLHFSHLEHLLGDKGMPRTARVVCPYKGEAVKTTDNANFNFQLARLRMIAEHVLGVLKGPWESLRKLRAQIASESDLKRAMEWIIACCVLHNICNACGDAVEEVADDVSPEQEDPMPASQGAEEARQRVKEDVLEFMQTTGEYRC